MNEEEITTDTAGAAAVDVNEKENGNKDQHVEPSPKQSLAMWAQDQESWIQKLVARVLSSGKALSVDELDQLYVTACIERGILEGPVGKQPDLNVSDVDGEQEISLVITAIDDIQNVNALVSGAHFEFGPNLTIVYGENGSGKTGVSRIVKRAAGERNTEEILHNVLDGEAATDPSATIKIELDGVGSEIPWKNEVGIDPLTAVRVFDSYSVNLHVDKELNYMVVPASLTLFELVSEDVGEVKRRIAEQITTVSESTEPIESEFNDGTDIHELVTKLKVDTPLDDLEGLAGLSPTQTKHLEQLRADLAGLTEDGLNQQLKSIAEDIGFIIVVNVVIEAVTAFEPDAYEKTLIELQSLKDKRKTFREQLFKTIDLPGEPDDEWERFIEAGQEYRDHVGIGHEPGEGELCIYCMQPLKDDARKLIAKYAEFLDDSAAEKIESQKVVLAEAKLKFEPGQLTALKGRLDGRTEVAPDDDFLSDLNDFVDETIRIDGLTQTEVAIETTNVKELASGVSLPVSKKLASLKTAKEETEAKKTDQTSAREKLRGQINPLADREKLVDVLPKIRKQRSQMALLEQLQKFSNHISYSVKSSLTDAAKQASENVLHGKFQECFSKECDDLNTPEVALTFPGEAGAAKRKKAVAAYPPSKILSEGELKSLALADFLAECTMRDETAPIMFDDPVSSLDYKRMKRVARRIAKLAETRQVIVLTHNTWFATELLDKTDKKLCQFHQVDKVEGRSGVVTSNANPRYELVTKIGGEINAILNAKRPTDAAALEKQAKDGYALIRTWCERFVESELLNKVSLRFRDNIMLGGLKGIKGEELSGAFDVIDPIYDRASDFIMGHSHALEQDNVVPTLDDLGKDFQALAELRKRVVD